MLLDEKISKIQNTVSFYSSSSIANREEIGNETRKSINYLNSLLSDMNVAAHKDDYEIVQMILACRNYKDLKDFISVNSRWWRILLFVFDPSNHTHDFWKWELLGYFFVLLPEQLPSKRIDLFIKLYLQSYTSINNKTYFKIIANSFNEIIKQRTECNECFSFLRNLDTKSSILNYLLVEKFGKKYQTPEIFFDNYHFVSGACDWPFFDEYYYSSIMFSTISVEWLIHILHADGHTDRKLLACARLLIDYVIAFDDSHGILVFDFIGKLWNNPKEYQLPDFFEDSAKQKFIVKANEKIIKLLNHKVFNEFFASFDFELDRQTFWQEYIDKCDIVKLFVPSSLYFKLKAKDNISNRYGVILTERAPAVLVMKFGPYVIIEFGEVGNALYLYSNAQQQYKELLSLNQIVSHKDFKSTDFQQITYKSTYGRLIHNNQWKETLKAWMRYALPKNFLT